MLKFKVDLPDDKQIEIQISKQATILEVKDLIRQQAEIKKEIDLVLLDNLLQDEAHVNKLLYNQEQDHLIVSFKQKQNTNKLKAFFKAAVPLIRTQTSKKAQSFVRKVTLQRSQTEGPEKKSNMNRLLSFFLEAPSKISSHSKERTTNFVEKIKVQQQLQQPSVIHNQEEEVPKNQNNDTVLGLLDDLKVKKQQEPRRKVKLLNLKHNPSPKALEYLERKRRAQEVLNNEEYKEKAKLLVNELRRERQLMQQRKHKQHEMSSEQVEESLEVYKKERDEQAQLLQIEKRERIQRRLEEMQLRQLEKEEMQRMQKQTIAQLKEKQRRQQESIKRKEEQALNTMLEEAKIKMEERKKLAVPIRLEDINKHAEQYEEQKQMLRLQRDQKKLEWEIKIQQETKQVYRAKRILDEVMKLDDQFKQREVAELQCKKDQIRRKKKYAEIIKEYHRPQISEQFKLSKIEQKSQPDNSVEELREYLHPSYQNSQKQESLPDKATRQREQKYEKSVKNLQKALSHNKRVKEDITDKLQLGKVPDPINYFHNRPKPKPSNPQLTEIPPQDIKRYRDYLTEQRKIKEQNERESLERISGDQKPKTSPLIKNKKESIQHLQRLEEEAKKKEELAKIMNDDEMKKDATEMFLQSIRAKLAYLGQHP